MTAAIYYKISGAWVQVGRPYVKDAGVWKPSDLVYRKISGVWTVANTYDVNPPNPPEVSLQLVTSDTGDQTVKVGVRQTSATPDLQRIRVLTTYSGAAPTTQYGGTYTLAADNTYPDEPWSDFSFNGFNNSPAGKDETAFHYKFWPRNPSSTSDLPSGTQYFAAWSEDSFGNWSIGTFATINIPKKGVDTSNKKVLETSFQVNSTGFWTNSSQTFTYGNPIQQASPNLRGLFFYGNQFTQTIGFNGPPTIKSAKIRIQRQNDGGLAAANVYLSRHMYGAPGGITPPLSVSDITLLGQVNLGETKWFDLPDSFIAALESGNVKGFGLHYKDPAKATAGADDFLILDSATNSARTGELHVVWSEQL